jgi:hypothetical protein
MQRSKNLALLFLLGAVLVGGVLGFTADRVLARDSFCTKRSDWVTMRRVLAEELDLSPKQRAAVDNILDRRHTDMTAALAPVKTQIIAVRDRARADIAKQLDSEQQVKFQRLIERMSDTTKDGSSR